MLPFQNLRLSVSFLSSIMAPRQLDRSTAHHQAQQDPTSAGAIARPSLSPHDGDLDTLLCHLNQRGIHAQKTHGRCPPEAAMHDRAAEIPSLVVSPLSEWGVCETLKLFNNLKLHGRIPISVKSGGHGYHNGAACAGVMLNLGRMTEKRVMDDMLFVGPGCLLGPLALTLARHRKAVPHGDCFGVGAGGHFTTAGWDLLLARRYGLGCQSVVGGRLVLWDGSVVEVNDCSHPDLLYAMRGGAAAEAGVVTEIKLRLIDEPARATWRFAHISEEQLRLCVANNAFARAATLPNDVSISFRFFFETDHPQPLCSFNIVSLLSASDTILVLSQYLGSEVASIVHDLSDWNEKTLLDLRLVPASEFIAKNPGALEEMCPVQLQDRPLTYWKESTSLREMARSYFTSISQWVVPDCDVLLLGLYDALKSAQTLPGRERMYALVIHGGGRMLELQEACAMPLGSTLARFELHWDTPEEAQWCRAFTEGISKVLEAKADPEHQRPYRGDIWLNEQGVDAELGKILNQYDKRLL